MSEKRDITGYSINARLKPKKEVEQKFKELAKYFQQQTGIEKLNKSQVLKLIVDTAYEAVIK
jgi:ABC-type phosphate/phosphonate transport system substrate-binding protein